MSFLTSILRMLQEILCHKLTKHKENGSDPQLQVTVPNLRTADLIGMFDLSSAPGREKEVVRAPYVRATFLKEKHHWFNHMPRERLAHSIIPLAPFCPSPLTHPYIQTHYTQPNLLPAGLQIQAMTYGSTSRKFPPLHAPYRWGH